MSKELIEQARNCNHAHEMIRGGQATPREELERQIMSSLVPKNEREHWAAREIESLREQVKMLRDALERAIATCFDITSYEQVMSNPSHLINKALAATEPKK